VVRRRWWLVLLAAALLVVGGGGVVWAQHTLRGGQDTVSVLLHLTERGSGQATVSVRRGRVADPGPFAQRVAALVAPTVQGSPVRVYTDLVGRLQLVDVSLARLPAQLRLDTQELQQELAAAGFRRLVVGLYSEDHWRVTPESAARAGTCFGNALSCEWRLATEGPSLEVEVRADQP
jgi:hypothetical protein